MPVEARLFILQQISKTSIPGKHKSFLLKRKDVCLYVCIFVQIDHVIRLTDWIFFVDLVFTHVQFRAVSSTLLKEKKDFITYSC